MRRSVCCVQRWRPSALDEEPEHERQLSDDGGLSKGIRPAIILRREYARKAQDDPGEAGESEPDAQEAWQESRPVNQQRERKKPQAPKHFGDNKSLKMQIKEQHSESLALRLFKYG